MAVGRSTEPGKMLMIGNSLLLAGVDLPALRDSLAPDLHLFRWMIEQTQYLDWYYGLRRLYSEGMRADFVVLLLNVTQTDSFQIRGEYFGYRMMQTRDVLDVARDARLTPTATFSLLLGNLSAYYGFRFDTRKIALAELVPGISSLRGSLVPFGHATLDHDFAVDFAAQRLRRFADLVQQHGGHFIFVVPASLDPIDEAYLKEAGARSGVPILVPLTTSSVSGKDFTDGFHLNPAGAARFTTALAPMLRESAHIQR
ncbi:MAG TPA: hypothetical protein VEU96_28140 [Bryobacteraceae bacterium]|nr:hypothetical protein [Bryobacteraceae bacterium]